jgi:PAS domain S-box-containing protein
MSWDVILMVRAERQRQEELRPLYALQTEFGWNADLDRLIMAEFQAIVVTDPDQRICWASNGFKAMTGYDVSFAKGKKSSFLQGKDTSVDVRKHIQSHLQLQLPVSGILINYRKSGVPYYCSVAITPLFNYAGELKHFIALEREIQTKPNVDHG